VPEVGALQETYETDIGHAIEELEHLLEDIEGCEHEGGGADLALQARASLVVVTDEVAALIAGHGAHTDVAECALAATDQGAVVAETDGLMGHHDAWKGAMHCGHHDEAGEEPHEG